MKVFHKVFCNELFKEGIVQQIISNEILYAVKGLTYKKGDRVIVEYHKNVFYVATVYNIRPKRNKLYLRFDDGEEKEYAISSKLIAGRTKLKRTKKGQLEKEDLEKWVTEKNPIANVWNKKIGKKKPKKLITDPNDFDVSPLVGSKVYGILVKGQDAFFGAKLALELNSTGEAVGVDIYKNMYGKYNPVFSGWYYKKAKTWTVHKANYGLDVPLSKEVKGKLEPVTDNKVADGIRSYIIGVQSEKMKKPVKENIFKDALKVLRKSFKGKGQKKGDVFKISNVELKDVVKALSKEGWKKAGRVRLSKIPDIDVKTKSTDMIKNGVAIEILETTYDLVRMKHKSVNVKSK